MGDRKMGRWVAAVLLAGCFNFQAWAQTPSSQPPAGQPPAAEPAPAGQTPSTPSSQASSQVSSQVTSQFPLDRFKEFSAIMVGGPAPGDEAAIHIYRSGNLIRMEANEGHSYQITDLAKQETHGMAKSGCLRYKSPYVRSYPFMFAGPENKYEVVAVGKETVDGHVCQIEELTISSPKFHSPVKIKLWEAEDLQGFPVKIETRMHRIIRYSNVVLGPQDPTLFIFPNECQNQEETIGKGASPRPMAKPPGKPQ
jgi:hypothetical protein